MRVEPPKPQYVMLAWHAADQAVESLAMDLPRWGKDPDRERMHRAVFAAIVHELEVAA